MTALIILKGVAETIKIDTPDPYINSAMRAQVMAMDNIWDNPVITHGAIGWHNGQRRLARRLLLCKCRLERQNKN